MSLIGWLTAFVSDTTMALVEDGEVLGSRQLDMGNSGLIASECCAVYAFTGTGVSTEL